MKREIKINKNQEYVVVDKYLGISQVVASLVDDKYVMIKNDYFQRFFGTNTQSLISRKQFEKTFKGFCDLTYISYDWKIYETKEESEDEIVMRVENLQEDINSFL